MNWKTLDDMELYGKRVLTRVDINVPMENGHITDATRIERIATTINDIKSKGGSPILLAHLGRPNGKVNPKLSLQQLVPTLEITFKCPVFFTDNPSRDWINEKPSDAVILLENMRFNEMEEQNTPALAQFLATLGDIFCNDAFSTCHRSHASTVGLAQLLPSCAGHLMQIELNALKSALSNPLRPVGAVVGGAKVSSKLELLQNLVKKIDTLVIGGCMANTFLAAQGAELGSSLQEPDLHNVARSILATADAENCRIILPRDGRISTIFAAHAPNKIISLNTQTQLKPDEMVLDAGDKTTEDIITEFRSLKTLIWNGPLGAFEIEPFNTATMKASKAAAAFTLSGSLITVAGGGDTVAALNQAGVVDEFSYVSTAGGAFLEWMEGKKLPGIAALL